MYLYCKISNIDTQDVKPVHEEISIFNPQFLGLLLQQLETAVRYGEFFVILISSGSK